MGKKGRRTRWRTLTIADERSDSEESNTTTGGHHVIKPKAYYSSRLSYSSQSTPTRRYDVTKSTRSSSTASETKITFNEDEYTRITTPRQDVLFKKGYLNKPKSYQTQTSTGNSTASTENSTGNGTPDHQSTDLEYDSQFVFPNAFVDQNGIYYVNSFEPYPVMVFNPPTAYYPDYTDPGRKRYSTGSLTESTTSPSNEETTSQPDQPENDVTITTNEQPEEPEPRRTKKRRRRRANMETTPETSSSSITDEEEEVLSEEEEESEKTKTYDLKPDAEEFIPRAYQNPPIDVQFIKIPSNFVPIPLHPIGDFNAFIPTGIPINFIQPHFVNCVTTTYKPLEIEEVEEVVKQEEENKVEENNEEVKTTGKPIDIAKIVSKLEEAVKEEEESGKKKKSYRRVMEEPKRNYSDTLKKTLVVKKSPIKVKNERGVSKEETVKNSANVTKTREVKKVVSPNEWISVSRKKRKNKEFEEIEEKVMPVEEDIVVVEEKTIESDEVVVVETIEAEKEEEKTIEVEEEKTIEAEEEEKTIEIEEVKTIDETSEALPPSIEKKSKKAKKKKKKVKNNTEEYDFLDESLEEKTNMEVCQELDRLIQRGMYNNLEEKMKSLNIESEDDQFLKTIISTISTTNPTKNKIGSFKALPEKDFLAECTTPEDCGGGGTPEVEEQYPVTKAVKEWMSQRGDVGILKSPSAIFKEFFEGSDEEDEGEVAAVVPKHGNLPYRAICCSIM